MYTNRTILDTTTGATSQWIDLAPFGGNSTTLEIVGSGVTIYGSNVPAPDNGPDVGTTYPTDGSDGDTEEGEGVSSVPNVAPTQVGVALHTTTGNEIYTCPMVRWIQIVATGAAQVHLYGFIWF
jgi:hypothetical protein